MKASDWPYIARCFAQLPSHFWLKCLHLTCHFHLILEALGHLPENEKERRERGEDGQQLPLIKFQKNLIIIHLCADMAFLFWQKLSLKKERGPTGRIRMPVSVCMCTRTLQRAALRATEGAFTSTALAQPAVRSVLSSRTPAAQKRTAQAPPQKRVFAEGFAKVAKGFAERRLLCTGSRPTPARWGPFPGRPPQPRSDLQSRQSPRPAAPPAREAAGPAAPPGAPGPTAAPRAPPPPWSRGPHLRGELQAACGFPGPSAAASRRLQLRLGLRLRPCPRRSPTRSSRPPGLSAPSAFGTALASGAGCGLRRCSPTTRHSIGPAHAAQPSNAP